MLFQIDTQLVPCSQKDIDTPIGWTKLTWSLAVAPLQVTWHPVIIIIQSVINVFAIIGRSYGLVFCSTFFRLYVFFHTKMAVYNIVL